MADTAIFMKTEDVRWGGSTEQDLLEVPPVPPEEAEWSAAGGAGNLQSDTAANGAANAPFKLVDLVKPGPSGTVASTAAAAAASQGAAIRAGPDIGPGGLAGAMSTAQTGSTAMQDLLRAAQKALASGLGDWHLQALQDISPQFQEHVLMGALGPETLKHKHKLPEQLILQLYGLLHRHCTGFQQEVQAAVAGAAHVEQLLASIWTAFAQLWDECVQVTFQGEVLAAMQELHGTYAALLNTQDTLAATQQENAALKECCNDFVKANLDHMLAWRSLKTKADALEAEVTMLSSANSEISLRSAAIQARNTQLTLQLESLGARLTGAEQQIKEREAALAGARIALVEKDSAFYRLDAQVAALEQQLVSAGQAANKQQAAHSDLHQQLDAKDQQVQDAERRVSDKQRAYNLLHADFAKQKAEAAEMAQRAVELEQQLAATQQQLAASKALVAKAESWRKRWEVCQMEVEDLQAANARATMRRQELVSSYWPVMDRLNAAENVVQTLTDQLQSFGHEPAACLAPRDASAADVTKLSAAASTANTGTCGPDSRTATTPAGQPQHAVNCSSTTSISEIDQNRPAPPPAAAAAQSSAAIGLVQSEQSAGMASIEPTLKQELHQLQDSYLLLQEEYWRQKERLMALELEAGELRASTEQAVETAAQVTAALAKAQQEAATYAHQCSKLEADIVGYKSWVRELEKTEHAYLKAIRHQGDLEDTATTAQRQLADCRLALAAAEANCCLARAAAEAVAKEGKQLMNQLAQEMNKSTLFEQELQRIHKQEISRSRAAQARLKEQFDRQTAELAAANSLASDALQQYNTAAREAEQLKAELQHARQHHSQMSQQLQQAQAFLAQTLQKLEGLESRVSVISSASISYIACSSSSEAGSQTVEAAAEAAVHLMERLLVTLQCLAADANTISNAAMAAKVEVLVRHLMDGLEASGAATAAGNRAGSTTRGLQIGASRSAQPGAAMPTAATLTVLRNAAGAANKQRLQELEQQVSVLQLRLAECRAQLSEALSSSGRLQRALQLKSLVCANLEQQLAAARSQIQQQQRSKASQDRTVLQLQQELAVTRLDFAQLQATATAQTGQLQAVTSLAAAAEGDLQGHQAAADEAAAACAAAMEQLAEEVAAARQHLLQAKTATGIAAAAQQEVEQLQALLTAAQQHAAELEADVADSRYRADISIQAARDADYKAVQTNTLLADARRALDMTQRMLDNLQASHAGAGIEGAEQLVATNCSSTAAAALSSEGATASAAANS